VVMEVRVVMKIRGLECPIRVLLSMVKRLGLIGVFLLGGEATR